MKTEQQKSDAGYTTLALAVVVSLIFGLTASIIMAVECQTVGDSHKKCSAKPDPATTGSCSGGCSPTDTCTGKQTEWDYTSCDQCTQDGNGCTEYVRWQPENCVGGNCLLKARTKNCTCYGPPSNKVCGIDPADATDWGNSVTVRLDECTN